MTKAGIDSVWAEKVSKILSKYRRQFGPAAVERVQECFLIAMGQVTHEIAGSQDRSNIYFPGLTNSPWLAPDDIEAVSILEKHWLPIRDELLALLHHRRGFQPYGIAKFTQSVGDWNVYYLKSQNLSFEENRSLCPETTRIIESLPGLGQVAMFSALNPGRRIAPHLGTWNVRLTVHLGLVIPQPCTIRVGGEAATWQEGRCLVFDDSYRHEVWNESDRTRFILFVDVWHPKLTQTEIKVLDEISQVISSEELKAAEIIEQNRGALLDKKWWVS